jgi:predicted aldo/keto reductase-like oxidoreductase
MREENRGLDRRDFMKKGAQATAVAAATVLCTSTSHGAAPKDKRITFPDTLPTRVLGKTGWKLPILAYGGAALPKAWLNPLSTEDRVKLVRYAYDRGLRYFDTAGNYLESQAILGEGLRDVRDDVYLVTKVETTDPDKVRGAVEKSLKEMQTDHLDAILIHGTPGIEQMSVEGAMEIHAELVKLQAEGITKFIGLSAHSYFDKALALISTGEFDLCMLAYGYIPRGYNQIFSARMLELRNACMAKAHELDMGIAAMKVVAAGMLGAWSGYIVPEFEKKRLKSLPAAAIRYVLEDDRVDLLVIGMRLEAEIDANIQMLAGDLTYTDDDRALLAEFSAMAYESDAIKKMRID